jgi:hypothetical protein
MKALKIANLVNIKASEDFLNRNNKNKADNRQFFSSIVMVLNQLLLLAR